MRCQQLRTNTSLNVVQQHAQINNRGGSRTSSAGLMLPEMLGKSTNELQNNNPDRFAYLVSLVR